MEEDYWRHQKLANGLLRIRIKKKKIPAHEGRAGQLPPIETHEEENAPDSDLDLGKVEDQNESNNDTHADEN